MSMTMRAAILVSLLCLSSPALAEDELVNQWLAQELESDEHTQDEPGLHKPLPKQKAGYFAPRDRGASLRVGYRGFSVAEMAGRDSWYDNVTVDFYPVSKIVRAGGGIEFGGDTSEQDNYLLSGTITAGVQWPWRVTPFLDFTLCFGALRWEVFHQEMWSFAYQVGLEVGADFFVHDKWFVSTAIGWRHVVFRHPGDEQVEPADVYHDSFTVKVSMGF